MGYAIKIKRLVPDLREPERIYEGEWIDLRCAQDTVLKAGEYTKIRLGVAMALPDGYEAHIVARSSTFKNWGFILTNGMSIIDNKYCGDNDEWHLPVMPFRNVTVYKNERICQFRIVKQQPPVAFIFVDELGNKDRGGFGSTGKE